ncbi:MAG: 2-oxoacid:acceptor oxidoreductase family protein [Endomicrobiaceae bacterium]|jgi:2-oxoglutarate ferredoxin oxidoreductase subunit gamma|nr:2-oxoacid:acceptor oxidoreductase family protein [Endomicrobiaceae bacterium]MDD3729881.1 2-oxoacid:acceptor oxidoreductase family protein [Endomicrobiaceae bacterium]MDD4166115.1 2-oxoacid:acceptor oxidoreductase family protein [Endomicrobiaceae bacterium]
MKTYNEIIIAGFGGQGVLLAGNILAQSAMEEGLNTTWFPSYGAEMRGGTANSTVIISDDEIGSPIAFNPSGLIALNALSLDKFLPRMSENAVIIANSSIINEDDYKNKNIIFIPISEIADKEIGNIRAANMVAVGALIKALNVPALDNVLNAVKNAFAKKEGLSELNIKAVKAGYDYKI